MNLEQSETTTGATASSSAASPGSDGPQGLYENFRVAVESDVDTIRVVPAGELDMATVPELDGCLEQALSSGCDQLVLDLRELAFLDSSGLQLILKWVDRAREASVGFRLIEGTGAVRRVFELAGLNAQIPIGPV